MLNFSVRILSKTKILEISKNLLLINLCFLPLEAAELELGVGPFVTSLPKYIGSDEQDDYFLPFPYIYYKSSKIEVDRNAFTGFLWHKNNWYLDFSASGNIPVKSNDTKARYGMPDIDFVGEVGPVVKYFFVGDFDISEKLFLGIHTRKAFSSDFSSIKTVGWSYGVSLEYSKKQPSFFYGNLSINTSINVDFSDDDYLNYYYGVTDQYTRTGRDTYAAKGGYKGSSLSLGFTWDNDRVWLGSFIKYNVLNGSQQQDSPLVKKDNNVSLGLGLVWIFYKK
jgi:outer membrane protein